MVVDDPTNVGNMLQSDIDKISRWAQKWLVKFNPSKSESLVISRKRNKPNLPNLLCPISKFRQFLVIST